MDTLKLGALRMRFAPLPTLTAILLLGAGLRFFSLGCESLWYDEALSLAIASRLTLPQILTNFAQSHHPPLYYLLLRTWLSLAGASAFSARFLSAASSLLSIPLIYRAGRDLFDTRVGLAAALMLAVQPFQIQYAQEARMYALLLLLTLITLLAFVKALQTGHLGWWGLYLAAFVLGLYTHYFIGLAVLACHLFVAVSWRSHRRFWPAILIIDLIALLAFSPQIGQLLQKTDVRWLVSPPVAYLLLTPYFLAFGSYLRSPVMTYAALFAVLGWMAIALYEIAKRAKSRPAPRWEGLLLLGALGPILLLFVVAQFKPVYLVRSLIVCTPFLTLLLALALQHTRRRSPQPYLALATGGLIAATLAGVYVSPTPTKEPLRQAAQFIEQARTSDDRLIHVSLWTALPFTFYSEPAANHVLAGDPQPLKPADVWHAFGGRTIAPGAIPAGERVWLVLSPLQMPESQMQQVEEMNRHRRVLSEERIDGLTLRLYGPVE